MRTILSTLHSKFIHNSLALPCLAAYCGEGCGELLIREFTTHEPRESVLAMILEAEPDVVAFSVYLWNRRETLELVDALTTANPDLRVVLGGPEVSFDGDAIFIQHPGITALIRGEGEQPLRELLSAWQQGEEPNAIPGTTLCRKGEVTSGPEGQQLKSLDDVPSPFRLGLSDISRGFVYYETSRGCPYRCSFCLSARDNQVRSYSMERIKSDLALLMENEVPKIKLVDRTFNYDANRAREIFSFILEHNRSSHFHFEIGAHLLDEETLKLLAETPRDIFQFEIGVQSTLEETLGAIERNVSLEKLEQNVSRLIADDRIHLHLDLVAGLPGENFEQFLTSIDRVIALKPHHLQIEPVKLLPGSPLRDQAEELQISFDPNPPYTILGSKELSFTELQRLQQISRLLDLTYNSECFRCFLGTLTKAMGSFSSGLSWLAGEWNQRGLFRFPMNRQAIFYNIVEIIETSEDLQSKQELVESLAYDYACCERIVTNRIPAFFDTKLTREEQAWVQDTVKAETEAIKGQGVKLQYFASVFNRLQTPGTRRVHLFLYLTQTGEKMKVEERHFSS